MISVVIPAYNEEKRISGTIRSIVSYFQLKKLKYEIIVVDDGSIDKTSDIIKDISNKNPCVRLLNNKRNQGKGFTVKKGMLSTNGNLILFMDADNSTKITELDGFFDHIKDFDILIGSRRVSGAHIQTKQPPSRKIQGAVFPYIVNLITVRGIKDTQCGFKLFKKDAAKVLFSKQKIKGFSFDVEILYLAKKYRYKIKEMPIVWNNDSQSKLHAWRDPIIMFIELLKIRITDLFDGYN